MFKVCFFAFLLRLLNSS